VFLFCSALPAILVPRGSSSSSGSSINSSGGSSVGGGVVGGGSGGVGGGGPNNNNNNNINNNLVSGSPEDLGSLADLTGDSLSDSTSLTSVPPTLDPSPPTESPPPGYMSEDGDSPDLQDITDYPGMNYSRIFMFYFEFIIIIHLTIM